MCTCHFPCGGSCWKNFSLEQGLQFNWISHWVISLPKTTNVPIQNTKGGLVLKISGLDVMGWVWISLVEVKYRAAYTANNRLTCSGAILRLLKLPLEMAGWRYEGFPRRLRTLEAITSAKLCLSFPRMFAPCCCMSHPVFGISWTPPFKMRHAYMIPFPSFIV